MQSARPGRLSIWGIVVVGLADNVVKPLILRGGMHMPSAVVFFALLGGLVAFGIIGLLLGPLVVSLFVALLRMYERDFGTVARRSSWYERCNAAKKIVSAREHWMEGTQLP